MINKKDLFDAITALDSQTLAECAPKRNYKRALTLRAIALLSAAAILLAAVPITVFAAKAPEEVPGVVTEMTETETFVPTSITSEELTRNETSENSFSTTENTISDPSQFIEFNKSIAGFYVRLAKNPLAIVRLIDRTDKTIKYNGETLVEIEYSPLYCIGGYNYYTNKEVLLNDLMFAMHRELYIPSVLLEEYENNDILCFQVEIIGLNSEHVLFAGTKKSNDLYSCSRFIDDRLFINHELESGFIMYNGSLRFFGRLIEKGYDFIHKELFDRMPQFFFDDGATIENIIDILNWHQDLYCTIKTEQQDKNRTVFGIRL